MSYRIKGQDLGPVPTVDIEVKPGINVLRGANGAGKSTVLDAVQYALTKSGPKPTPRDGTRAGRIEAFGATVTFTSLATAKGNLEVESLSGKLDIGDLIDPGYEDQAVCDKHRIRKLIDLSGAEAKTSTFAELIKGVKLGSVPTDMIDAADFVKRLLQQQALDAERESESKRGKAAAAREAMSGVDLTAECDEDALRERYVEAAADLSELRERKQQVETQRLAAEQARAKLSEITNPPPQTVEEAKDEFNRVSLERDRANSAVADYARLLAKAKAEYESLQRESVAASRAVQNAETTARIIDQCRAQIEAGERLEPIDDLAIEVRRTECENARKAMETGAVVRKAKEQADAAEDFENEAKIAADEAASLRMRAAATDDILAAELQRIGCPWRPVDVPKGNGTERRLVCKHKRGESTLVSDLSAGERARHAIDVALHLAGKSDKPAVLILRQEQFEGLQPAVRQEIDEHARERNVVILTAAASDDEGVTV